MIDRLQLHLEGTDPAQRRRPCGCRGSGRGAHQSGCSLRGRVAFQRRAHARFAVVRLLGVVAASRAWRRLVACAGGRAALLRLLGAA